MSKIILDEFPKEPKECPFCEVEKCWGGTNYDREVYYCHLREGVGFNCEYTLKECVGCDKCKKITSSLQEVKIKSVLNFTKDVFDIDLQSETYSGCVRELKEILRIDED